MIKVVKDLNIDLAAELTTNVATGSEPDELESDSDEDEDISQEGEDGNELMEELVTSLPDSIAHVRCGVHTLQLAIQDGLKNANAASMIARIRNLAVELRTPKISEKVKKAGLRMAVLDQETRWGSTYLMVERVLELKGFVNESVEIFNKNLQLTAPQWRQAQELKDLLQKSYLVTKKLQLDDLTPGYFFRKWKGLRDVFQVHDSIIAGEILRSMKKREAELLSPTFLAAIYLDASNMDKLTAEQKDVAEAAVLQLVLKMKSLETPADNSDCMDSPAVSSSAGDDSNSDEDMREAEKILQAQNTSGSAVFQDSDHEIEIQHGPSATSTSHRSEPAPKKRKELTPKVSKH
jgi:hypothetical protein